jgi:hypothetical protein
MTVLDIEEKAGVWFDMEGGGRVQLRALSAEDWRKIRKATVAVKPFVHEYEVKINGVAVKKFEVLNQEVIDPDLQIIMTNDMSIVGWENLFDKNENPIPCTAENKSRLMYLKDPTFRDFVNEKISILNGIEAEKVGASEKN